MRTAFRASILAGVIAATALVAVPSNSGAAQSELNPIHVMPTTAHARDNGLPAPAAAAGSKAGRQRSNGIDYHGGPVMVAPTTNVYVIWYGDWGATTGPQKQTIITDFLRTVGGSPYYNINTTYYNGANAKVKNSVTYVKATLDPGSQGTTNLSDGDITTIVSSAITNKSLPADADGVYFVLTSGDVTKTGFLTQYCGWHTHATILGTDIKYSFVGDPTAQLASCATQTLSSPNGNPAADAMVSVIAHELVEAVTDPDLNAWYDSRGYENADKCAWTFGTIGTAANGSQFNMTLGDKPYMIQRNWVNASGGYCAISY